MLGTTLLHYRITGRIGAGGMGEVYRANDTKLERDVALKILPTEMASDPERLERFRREARAIAALNHPHIVTAFSVEHDAGMHFLTMELVEGRPLDEILAAEGGFDRETFFDIAIALADAVASAHARGIVHRDLKPANLMLDAEGRLKVLDFGLAKRAAGATTAAEETQQLVTAVGSVIGTAPYMSPEQAKGLTVASQATSSRLRPCSASWPLAVAPSTVTAFRSFSTPSSVTSRRRSRRRDPICPASTEFWRSTSSRTRGINVRPRPRCATSCERWLGRPRPLVSRLPCCQPSLPPTLCVRRRLEVAQAAERAPAPFPLAVP